MRFFKGNDTQYYLYNKDIWGSITSLVKEDGSVDATYPVYGFWRDNYSWR